MQIKKSKDVVEKLLRELPHLRDDDNKLLSSVWYVQIKDLGFLPEDLSGYDILKMIADNKLANSESIRRVRQKLQEVNPALRGKIYAERHKHIEKVKQDLKSFKVYR
tara:strand:+ start:29238 stop:29558 length:321 start_codon:yes stop_codon:yes gene_type:complete